MRMPLTALLILLIACKQPAQNKPDMLAKQDTAKPLHDSVTAVVKDTSKPPHLNLQKLKTEFHREKIVLKSKPDSFFLTLPVGYHIQVANEGFRRLRFMAESPDNRLFVTDMFDKSDNRKGVVLVFDQWDESKKQFQKIDTFLSNLHNPNQVGFYGEYIYVAETQQLRRFKYQAGDLHPSDSGEIIMNFPDYGLGYKYGGWHLTRSLGFHNNKIYVAVGSSCNACIEKEEIRATVIEADPDGKNQRYFARGLRNTVGLKWIGNQLWGTGMGRDLIGPDRPEDLFQQIESDQFYGWPYYYQFRNKIYADSSFRDSARAAWVKEPPVALTGFLAHSAPLGFEYFSSFSDPQLDESILVCLHGSTSVWRQRGNAVVRLEKNGYINFISGFLEGKTEAGRHGRPCDIIRKDEHAFFFTDDHKGVLYYVWKE